MRGGVNKQLHPAWMLGAGTILWLLEIAAILYWHLVKNPQSSMPQWQIWTCIITLHLLTATWFGLMWPKVMRWRRRKSQRVSPEVRAEKERIAQDLHDGVGSHLVNAIALLEMPQPDIERIRLVTGHAMLALRTEMEALDDVDATLIERLSSLRWRMQPLLQARGMSMQWEMPCHEKDNSTRSVKGVQLALIAQEAMSNAIQHSGGKTILIKLLEAPDGEQILEISDDGKGFAQAKLPTGHDFKSQRGWGLNGMRNRAQLIDAKFNFNTSDQGTLIRLTWRDMKLN